MPRGLSSTSLSAPAKWWRRRPPTGIAGAVFWLALWFGLLWLVGQVPAARGTLLSWMQVLVGAALIGLAVPLAWRLANQHLLWSLRNKLILTYLLIGVAPAVLFVTLVGLSAYVAAGQFSIHLADSRMHQELDEMGVENAARISRMARVMRDRAQPPAPGTRPQDRPPGGFRRPRQALAPGQSAAPAAAATANQSAQTSAQTAAQAADQVLALGEAAPDPLLARLHQHTSIYVNDAPLPGFYGAPPAAPGESPPTTAQAPLGLPPWATDLRGNQFRGLVLDGEDLYLVAVDQRHMEGGDRLTIVDSLPVDGAFMDVVAQGLGRVRLSGLMTGNPQTQQPANTVESARSNARRIAGRDLQRTSVYGGVEPDAAYFCDFRVPFISTMDITDWDTGDPDNVPIEVHSRPSKLYRQLFGSSLGGVVTDFIRDGFIALCIVFALIEALALVMAIRLSRDITGNVAALYAATQRVDHGDFVQRIPVPRNETPDQLGELARSFNSMTGSLERLMLEQKEKERLQSELTIAQEVQANLFPHQQHDLPTLQLHGICRPARTVSGDYYDFLIFRRPDAPDGTPGAESGVAIVLGDISGKGISAALLMATLHSAVRAYRLASEDLVYSDTTFAGLVANREGRAGDSGKLFESPGRILSLLNRHLYRTTQAEKYATLFLAHYDSATSRLTYSNAGHLPPLVLSRDGTIRRLDRGGTVVGLMDGMRYEEDSFQMQPGDILVAYSDGVTEPENDFGEFGEARLMEIVARYRDQPLEVISAQVMLALDAWIGAEEQPDDITLVLARQI
jgi:sigma-B regulation protein RsbU (phosphoserine phosphatase)